MVCIQNRLLTAAATAALALGLSACGGGGGSSAIPSIGGSGSSPTQPAQKTGPANLTITIPPPSQQNTHFRPGYISAATQSMTVGLVSGTTITSLATVNLTQSSPNCTVPSGGGLQCTTTVQAPFGSDTFAISTYSGLNGTGSVLSTGQVLATLTAGGTEPTVAISLNGVPATVALVLGTATLPVGYAGSTSVIVQAQDASGNLIIGPGLFSTPIDLAISGDTYSTLSLSSSSVTAPGQVVTLSYNGGTNVGSTITPSGSGLTSATAVTFNATGAVLTMYQYLNAATGLYIEPYSIAAFPNQTAAVLAYVDYTDCDCDPYGIAVANTSTLTNIFVGDTTDPFVAPSSEPTDPGTTVVHGMSLNLESDFADNIAAGPNGTTYYGGDVSTESDPNNGCYDNSETTGTLGVLNTTAGTTTEHVLKGSIGPMKVDSAGDVWWIEQTGSCYNGETTTYLLGSDEYAIGELPAGSSTPTEKPFSAAGLSGLSDVEDVAISPDGTQLFIATYNTGIAKIATATLTAPTIITPSLSEWPYTIATAPNYTTMWFSDSEGQGDTYFYGYVPGSSFAQGSVAEVTFPIEDFKSYSMTYADQSFWVAGESGGGIGRVSGLLATTPAPLNAFYQIPPAEDEQYLGSISAAGGVVWSADECQGIINLLQYGVPSSGTVTYSRTRTFGSFRNRSRLPMHHRSGHFIRHRTA